MPKAHPPHPLVGVLARNVQHLAFKRGWSPSYLAQELGITTHMVSRLRLGQNRLIDPEVFSALLTVFNCEPNDLLTRQPDIDYNNNNSSSSVDRKPKRRPKD